MGVKIYFFTQFFILEVSLITSPICHSCSSHSNYRKCTIYESSFCIHSHSHSTQCKIASQYGYMTAIMAERFTYDFLRCCLSGLDSSVFVFHSQCRYQLLNYSVLQKYLYIIFQNCVILTFVFHSLNIGGALWSYNCNLYIWPTLTLTLSQV